MSTTRSMSDSRVAALEKAVGEILGRLEKIEAAFSTVRQGGVEVLRVKCDTGDEAIERVDQAENEVVDLMSKVEACALKLCEIEQAWPALPANSASYAKASSSAPNKSVAGSKASSSAPKVARVAAVGGKSGGSRGTGGKLGALHAAGKITFGDRLRSTSDQILVIGDSLARGAGSKLARQCGSVVQFDATSGAKLDVIGEKISSVDDQNAHIVMIAGANNVHGASTYSDLVDAFIGSMRRIRSAKCCSVTVVGLTKRYDKVGLALERTRIRVNDKIRQLCWEAGFKYLGFDPLRSDVHADGLHFNSVGQNKLAKKIFRHCKSSCKAFLE